VKSSLQKEKKPCTSMATLNGLEETEHTYGIYLLSKCLRVHLSHTARWNTSSQPMCSHLAVWWIDITCWINSRTSSWKLSGLDGQISWGKADSSLKCRNSGSLRMNSRCPKVCTRGMTSRPDWCA
jgi:hypothetical protein